MLKKLFNVACHLFLLLSNPFGFALQIDHKKTGSDCPKIGGDLPCALAKNAPPEICKGFELISGNLTYAKWVLLGEEHGRHKETEQCIDDLTKNKGKHEVLVESEESEIETECDSQNKLRTCFGWDDMREWSRSITQDPLYYEYRYVASMEKAFNDKKMSDKKFDKVIKDFFATQKQDLELINQKIKTLDGENIETAKNARKAVIQEKEICEKVLRLRAETKTYKQIFKHWMIELNNKRAKAKLDPISFESCLIRNKAMIKTLRNHAEFFTVVVAGLDHVSPNNSYYSPEKREKNTAAQYVISELEKTKDQNPYAILAMIDK
jgi:hypothetical protein